jgi:hypothetical protein
VAEIRTHLATVKRMAGSKGVTVEEVVRSGEREFKSYFTVWLGDGHGLSIGDQARFYGELSTKKTEKGGRTYFDLNLNNAQVVAGTLVKPEPRGSWEVGAEPGAGSVWGS